MDVYPNHEWVIQRGVEIEVKEERISDLKINSSKEELSYFRHRAEGRSLNT